MYGGTVVISRTSSLTGAATVGKIGEAVTHFKQARTDARRGGGIEQFDVGDDQVDLIDGLIRPLNPGQYGRRATPGTAAGPACPRS